MGQIKRMVISIILSIIVLVLIYFVFHAIASLKQGYSLSEMDWNQNGKTSIEEFFRASDIGKRDVKENGKKCVEYFAYKDGLAVKTVCGKK